MSAPERDGYRVVVVGGGTSACYTAYHLASPAPAPSSCSTAATSPPRLRAQRRGGAPAVGDRRDGALAREWSPAYRPLRLEFGYNIWFRQGGYLFLASEAAELAELARMQAVVSGEGLPIERLTPEGIAAKVPALDLTGVGGGSYLPSDGTLHPFPAVWGVCGPPGLGVEVRLGVEVGGIARGDGRVRGVTTPGGTIRATPWSTPPADGPRSSPGRG